jgi:hypothetical protein
MENIVIYSKEGRIKCVPFTKNWLNKDQLIEQGWNPIRMINPVTVIEYLHNDCPKEDLYNEVMELGVES